MGRAPFCEKNGLKKGPWTPDEDQTLIDYIHKHGHGNWRTLPKNAGLQRCGKSCRLRWTNYLRPDIKRGRFSFDEEETIIQLHRVLGNKWSAIAASLPGRTDNEIKNYWNTHIRKRLLRMGIDPVTHAPRFLNFFLLQQISLSRLLGGLNPHLLSSPTASLLSSQSPGPMSNLGFQNPQDYTMTQSSPILSPAQVTEQPNTDQLLAVDESYWQPNEWESYNDVQPSNLTGGGDYYLPRLTVEEDGGYYGDPQPSTRGGYPPPSDSSTLYSLGDVNDFSCLQPAPLLSDFSTPPSTSSSSHLTAEEELEMHHRDVIISYSGQQENYSLLE
ncbi:unnamed protein product [Cuscuta epithymum]|uniref:Uncharacterized protein n=1 Tax=Cuscuta epithymum TaxID=186058 RepID=A0AAV0E123_9ASTE|nr:unnamed protein product [Cuscuta epithymum]